MSDLFNVLFCFVSYFQAMEVIKKQNLSAAIFAPGWVMEKLGEKEFIANQDK